MELVTPRTIIEALTIIAFGIWAFVVKNESREFNKSLKEFISDRLGPIEKKINEVDKKVEIVDKKVNGHAERLARVETKVES